MEGFRLRSAWNAAASTSHGWLAQSFTWNTSNPSDRFNGPVTWTDRSNDYQLNQAYIFAEKATDTGGCGWDFGCRADVMGGTDYRFNTRGRSGNSRLLPDPEDQHAAVLRPGVHPVLPGSGLQRPEGQSRSLLRPGRLRSRADNRQLLPQLALYLPIRRTVHHDRRARHVAVQRERVARRRYRRTAGITSTTPATRTRAACSAYTEKFSDGASFAGAWTIGNEPNTFNA